MKTKILKTEVGKNKQNKYTDTNIFIMKFVMMRV